MGAGNWTVDDYKLYNKAAKRTYDSTTGRVSNQEFKQSFLNPDLDPSNFTIRECLNTEEHPNTIPIILALDVTGSMGQSCKETAEALGVIMTNLYKKYKDVEFCIMGIGDLAYDDAPIQMSQFESDVRIAEALDKLYLEFGGGGNSYESYTAAWYMALYRTKIDSFEKQGRKGIVITIGDETLNPYLPKKYFNDKKNFENQQNDIETDSLYKNVSEKFDVFHIAVNDRSNSYARYETEISNTFGKLLGNKLKISTINNLSKCIEECIDESINSATNNYESTNGANSLNNNEISW